MSKKTSSHTLRVAFMGNFSPEKGSRVFVDIIAQCKKEGLPIAWSIFGGIGDEVSFKRASALASLGTTGFYGTSELPRLLHSRGIELGLLLSQFPESYSKLSRECWQQGLPLIYNKVGVLEQIAFSDFGVDVLQRNLPAVVKKLQKICEKPNLLEEEKKRIQHALLHSQLISANDKHVKYLELYQSEYIRPVGDVSASE